MAVARVSSAHLLLLAITLSFGAVVVSESSDEFEDAAPTREFDSLAKASSYERQPSNGPREVVSTNTASLRPVDDILLIQQNIERQQQERRQALALAAKSEVADKHSAPDSTLQEGSGDSIQLRSQDQLASDIEALMQIRNRLSQASQPVSLLEQPATEQIQAPQAVHVEPQGIGQFQPTQPMRIQDTFLASPVASQGQPALFQAMNMRGTTQTSAQACGGIGQAPCGGYTTATAYAPDHSSCTPQCTWQCDSPKCDEVCEPECQPPRCETRCSSADLSACSMDCEEPHCAVVCPQSNCPLNSCAECSTTCSEPMCKLQCPQSQPCRNVCEKPSCEWKCSAPSECPAPQCHMVCESPRNCMGNTYASIPPLSPGETSVKSFVAPVQESGAASLLQTDKQRELRGGAQIQKPSAKSVSVTAVVQRDENQEHQQVTLPVKSAQGK